MGSKKRKIYCFVKKLIYLILKQWSIYLAIVVLISLLMMWHYVPCFEEYWFGKQNRAKSETLAYIGAIIGGIILLGNLYENARRNNLREKSNMDMRFKDAATLLGSQDTSSILAGIFALHQIAIDSKLHYHKDYASIIREIFCAQIRENKESSKQFIIQTILDLLVKTDIYKIQK